MCNIMWMLKHFTLFIWSRSSLKIVGVLQNSSTRLGNIAQTQLCVHHVKDKVISSEDSVREKTRVPTTIFAKYPLHCGPNT